MPLERERERERESQFGLNSSVKPKWKDIKITLLLDTWERRDLTMWRERKVVQTCHSVGLESDCDWCFYTPKEGGKNCLVWI
jgi:hypothetical protein